MGNTDEKRVRVSEASWKLLQEHQKRAKDQLGLDLSFDKIIGLSLDRPIIILKRDIKDKRKQYSSVFDEPIGKEW